MSFPRQSINLFSVQIRKIIYFMRLPFKLHHLLEFYFIKSLDQILNSPNTGLFIMVTLFANVLFLDLSKTEWYQHDSKKVK